MRDMSALLAVRDRETGIRFYKEALGLEVNQDFGADVTLSGSVALQALESCRELIGGNGACQRAVF